MPAVRTSPPSSSPSDPPLGSRDAGTDFGDVARAASPKFVSSHTEFGGRARGAPAASPTPMARIAFATEPITFCKNGDQIAGGAPRSHLPRLFASDTGAPRESR